MRAAQPRRAGVLLALGALLALSARDGAAEEPRGTVPGEDGASASSEFLVRQGKLLFDYGRFDEAADAFAQACATPPGDADFSCWQSLAAAAERAGRVGQAIDAWARADDLGGEGSLVARQEMGRLLAAFGELRIALPAGRSLPTFPGTLEYEGLLIDPAQKGQLALVQRRIAEAGIERDSVWLPAGRYRFDGLAFGVEAGRGTEVALPARLVPYRPAAFRAPGGLAPAPAGGPWEVGGDVEVAAGGVGGGGLGAGPVGVAGRVRAGHHLGPLRLEVAARLGGTPVASAGPDPEGARDGTAVLAVASLDVGVDLALGPRVYLTPHAAAVAGSLGRVLVACRVVQASTKWAWDGECALGTAAGGGLAGLDLQVVLPQREGRVALRLGVFGEALSGSLLAVPGDRLGGEIEVDIARLARWRFAWLRGGVDAGLSLRF